VVVNTRYAIAGRATYWLADSYTYPQDFTTTGARKRVGAGQESDGSINRLKQNAQQIKFKKTKAELKN
jgi:hypothetical protein